MSEREEGKEEEEEEKKEQEKSSRSFRSAPTPPPVPAWSIASRWSAAPGRSGAQAKRRGAQSSGEGERGPSSKSSHSFDLEAAEREEEQKEEEEEEKKRKKRTINSFDSPVVTSIPLVSKFSGWPGVMDPHWRNCLSWSIC